MTIILLHLFDFKVDLGFIDEIWNYVGPFNKII